MKMKGFRLCLLGLLWALLFSTAAHASLIDVVAPADGKQQQFGVSVAVEGNTLVVGAPMAVVDEVVCGAAYLFVRDSGGVWREQARLVPAMKQKDARFGYAVALSGNTVAVGAYRYDAGTQVDVGAVHVFEREGATWQESQLVLPTSQANEYFGRALALSGNTLLIGAPGRDLGTFPFDKEDAGAVFVFERSGKSWWPKALLTAETNAQKGDGFGNAVALSQNTAVIGAFTTGRDGKEEAGAAYVVNRLGEGWSTPIRLASPVAQAREWFGSAVAIAGDTVVVGASAADIEGKADIGAVYVFVKQGEGWSVPTLLNRPLGQAGERFGYAVAVEEDTLAVGAFAAASPEGYSTGTLSVWTRSALNDWTQRLQFVPAGAKAGDRFGYSVVLKGRTLWVGAPTFGALSDGAVHVLRPPGEGGEFCQVSTDCAGGYCNETLTPQRCGRLVNAACQSNSECLENQCVSGVCRRALGAECSGAEVCSSGFCVDGVCCDSACGGGATNDCSACSFKTGAVTNGVCGTVRREADVMCLGPSDQLCDLGVFCDGTSDQCPAQRRAAPAGTVCKERSQKEREVLCDGVRLDCPLSSLNPSQSQDASSPNSVSPKSSCRCSAAAPMALGFDWLIPSLLLLLARRRQRLQRSISISIQ